MAFMRRLKLFCRSFNTSRLSPSIIRFCVVSQSTLSSGHGRSVPVEGVSASRRARRFPCQLRPYFSSLSPTASPRSWRSTSKSTLPSVNASGNRACRRSRLSAITSTERVSGSPATIFSITRLSLTVWPERHPGRRADVQAPCSGRLGGTSVSPCLRRIV